MSEEGSHSLLRPAQHTTPGYKCYMVWDYGACRFPCLSSWLWFSFPCQSPFCTKHGYAELKNTWLRITNLVGNLYDYRVILDLCETYHGLLWQSSISVYNVVALSTMPIQLWQEVLTPLLLVWCTYSAVQTKLEQECAPVLWPIWHGHPLCTHVRW